jgi:hypothetical protein
MEMEGQQRRSCGCPGDIHHRRGGCVLSVSRRIIRRERLRSTLTSRLRKGNSSRLQQRLSSSKAVLEGASDLDEVNLALLQQNDRQFAIDVGDSRRLSNPRACRIGHTAGTRPGLRRFGWAAASLFSVAALTLLLEDLVVS